MTIVIDARLLLPQETGVGRYLTLLAKVLPHLPGEEQYEFWLQSGLPATHPIWETAGNRLRLRRLPVRHMDLRAQWVVPRQLMSARPELFHYPHFDLPFASPGRIVVTIHDLKYIARPDFFPRTGRLKRTVLRAMMAYAAQRAWRVMTVSEYTRQDIIRRLKIVPDKIEVTPSGVNLDTFKAPAQSQNMAIRTRYRLEYPYILFVGERRPHKNIVGVIHSFDHFRRLINEPYQLVIAGQPYADYRQPEETVARLKLQESVRFIDALPDADLPALYQGAQALLFISYYEGFGLPPIESMAAGTPVVAANRTSLPEIVGDAGLLVDPDDPQDAARALAEVVSSGEVRRMCIARGLERSREFSWENTARRTLEVYREAINS